MTPAELKALVRATCEANRRAPAGMVLQLLAYVEELERQIQRPPNPATPGDGSNVIQAPS